nr:nuclear pore complex protein NUP205 [Ipomoea batatas]
MWWQGGWGYILPFKVWRLAMCLCSSPYVRQWPGLPSGICLVLVHYRSKMVRGTNERCHRRIAISLLDHLAGGEAVLFADVVVALGYHGVCCQSIKKLKKAGLGPHQSETQVFNEQSPSGKDYLAEDGFPLESMQRVCTLEAELALLLRISYKYRKSGAQVLFSMDALEHISSCKALKMQIKGSHHRFETKFGRELSVDVDKQRMVIAPILRLVFSLTSLVDTSEFFQVSNKVVRGVLEFIRGHALLFDQILREDLSGADELTMEQVNLVVSILTKIWPYEESDDYGFVQGLCTMMRVIFSLDLDSFISNKSMCYIEMDGMSESEFNQALNIELKHIIEVLSL